jgi:hypothetical protein
MFENNAKSAEREGEYAKEVAGMRNYRTQSAIAGTGWQSPEYAYWAADTPVLNPMAPATSSPLIPLVSGLANAGMGYYSMMK